MVGLKNTTDAYASVLRADSDGSNKDEAQSPRTADAAVETARRDRVMAAAERVMRKHRDTFAALAK